MFIIANIFIKSMAGIFTHVKSRRSYIKQGIHVFSGVIDLNYRGNISILLHNSSNTPLRKE